MMIQVFSTPHTAGGATAVPERLDDAVVLDIGLDDLQIGSTRLAKVDGRRICVARTAGGVFAVDHACPHEGYGLTQGNLDGDLLTCAWHNWKFDVTTGACVIGEEAVPTHDVDVRDDGAIAVRVRRPDPVEERRRLVGSLERGIEQNYVGQIARDVARLLDLGAEPAEIAAVAVEYGAPRGEWGWGHAIAALTDCLAMVDLFDGDQRAVPLVQGISLVAHDERGRLPRALPEPAAGMSAAEFVTAVEREDLVGAQAGLLGALERGAGPDELLGWFVPVSAAHLLSYGHGAIYTHKAFELLDAIGWNHAPTVLGHLVTSLVTSTREDTLPYYRPFGRELPESELDRLAELTTIGDVEPDAAAAGCGDDLGTALLGSDRSAAASAVVACIEAGVAVDAILDVIVEVVSIRLLRHDTAVEFDLDDDFGWLDVTHGLTYAHAVRYLLARWRELPADDESDRCRRACAVRLVSTAAFLANWTGRHEWHTRVGPTVATSLDAELADSASMSELVEVGERLQRRALDDVATAPIHVEHAIKNARAAHVEARRSGDGRVLAAVARYLDGPRQERGVRATTHRSIEFVAGRLRR